jgi:hypothetical protein
MIAVAQGCWAAGMALLAAEAGAAGAGAVAAGLVGGNVSGPLLPQPASVATTRQNGSNKRDRRMVRVP